jgi:hypothetical protein
MNADPASPAIILIESRYWVLNARLANPVPTPEQITETVAGFHGTLIAGNELNAEITRHPLDNYSETTPVLKISFAKPVMERLSGKFLSNRKEISLESVECWLTDIEMLNVYAVFRLDPGIDIKSFEETEMGLVDILSSLQPDLEALFRMMERGRIISSHTNALFGVPESLRMHDLHNADYSYLYSWHLFFPENRDLLNQTVEAYGFENNVLPITGGRVYTGWALLLWDTPEKSTDIPGMIRRIFIDSLAGAESVLYDNSISCFTGFLDLIIRNEKADCQYIRNLCNISHLQLQRIKLWKRNLSVEQQEYHERIRQVQMLEGKKADFDAAEETLIRAVEGIDVKESQKSGRIIELVLSFFTALSLYSVATDIYTIITTESDVKPIHLLSLRTMLIFLATGVVIGFFYLLRKTRNS